MGRCLLVNGRVGDKGQKENPRLDSRHLGAVCDDQDAGRWSGDGLATETKETRQV